MKRTIAIILVVSILMLTGVGSVLHGDYANQKTISIHPLRQTALAQYNTHAPIVITSNADFAANDATGVGTRSDPYTFKNLRIVATETCIEVRDTTAFFVISNCKLQSGRADPVIWFQDLENGIVENSDVFGGSSGLELNQVIDCSATGNSFYGGYNGVLVFNSQNNTIIENEIHNNQRGVMLDWSDHSSIVNNSIYSNSGYGIEVAFYSSNNTIYGNSLGWNHDENAFDDGEDNNFDDGVSIGNLWSDYNSSESYQIPGLGGDIDDFANILIDTTAPVIVPQYDTAIDVESTGNTLTWLAGDQFPASYIVQENDAIATSGIWNGEAITIDLDHLIVGTYAITIIIHDGAGNTASDDVFVSVVSFLLGGLGTELVMLASGITVASFIIIIILIKKLS
ncbi:MAG: NosD domain-containing protein [Candidatus Thorarchaeota archaeon]